MKRLEWTFLAALLMGGCAQTPKPAETAEAEVPIQPAAMHPESLTKPESLVYPWSVVPGGVFSREAARQAVDRDPIVEEHYRAVRVANLRSEQLTKAKSAYVSYRKGDTIYWTRNPVLLKAGETVLTDGESMIRGRCGNMVSETPRTPVAPVHLEPPPPAMEVPVPASRLVAAIPPALSREDPEPGRVVTDRAPSINTSILPSPTPVQGLPGYSPMGAIGFVPVAGGGGGTPAASNPAPDSPPPAVTRPPGETTTPPPIHPPIPIVVTPLTPPGPPTGPPGFNRHRSGRRTGIHRRARRRYRLRRCTIRRRIIRRGRPLLIGPRPLSRLISRRRRGRPPLSLRRLISRRQAIRRISRLPRATRHSIHHRRSHRQRFRSLPRSY